MKQSRFIEQIMVVGDGEKMPAALIQPNFEFIQDWAKLKNIELGDGSNKAISENDLVKERIQEDVDFYNQKFGKWERVKVIELTPDVWGIEEGHLTPTMKLKRRNIRKLYSKQYNRIYGHD